MSTKLEINKEKNIVIIGGKEYPPTHYNMCVWKEYLRTNDEEILNKLSTISLDI